MTHHLNQAREISFKFHTVMRVGLLHYVISYALYMLFGNFTNNFSLQLVFLLCLYLFHRCY